MRTVVPALVALSLTFIPTPELPATEYYVDVGAERIGDGSDLKVDIAVDPIDGTTSVARGLPGAISTVALAARGMMSCPREFVYMNKIATGPEARRVIDITASVATNLNNVARAKNREISEITVVVLDRPRHEELLSEIRAAGARVKLISDGDVGACIEAALPENEVVRSWVEEAGVKPTPSPQKENDKKDKEEETKQ